jgi:hypothetical protein
MDGRVIGFRPFLDAFDMHHADGIPPRSEHNLGAANGGAYLDAIRLARSAIARRVSVVSKRNNGSGSIARSTTRPPTRL